MTSYSEILETKIEEYTLRGLLDVKRGFRKGIEDVINFWIDVRKSWKLLERDCDNFIIADFILGDERAPLFRSLMSVYNRNNSVIDSPYYPICRTNAVKRLRDLNRQKLNYRPIYFLIMDDCNWMTASPYISVASLCRVRKFLHSYVNHLSHYDPHAVERKPSRLFVRLFNDMAHSLLPLKIVDFNKSEEISFINSLRFIAKMADNTDSTSLYGYCYYDKHEIS